MHHMRDVCGSHMYTHSSKATVSAHTYSQCLKRFPLVPWQLWQSSYMCRMSLITRQQGIPGVHFQKTERSAAEQLICNPTGSFLCTCAPCNVHTHGIDHADGMPPSSARDLHASSHIVYRLNKHASVFISALKAASYSLCAYGWMDNNLLCSCRMNRHLHYVQTFTVSNCCNECHHTYDFANVKTSP